MAEETNSGAPATEAEVNAAAAAELEQSKTVEEKPATESGTGTQATTSTKAPTDKTKPTEQAFDAQKRYEDLEKRYKDLQREFTPLSQERSTSRKKMEEMEKQLKQFQEALAAATEKPIDIEQFKRDFEAHGPKALDSYLKARLDKELGKMREGYEAKFKESGDRYRSLEFNHGVLIRANDEEHYPNFRELYPKMVEIAGEENCPVNMNMEMPQILDALYKLAKDRSSEEAVKIAAQEGRKKAEAELARESKTTVATGGKTASTTSPDLENMPLDKLEQLVVQMHGVANRD